MKNRYFLFIFFSIPHFPPNNIPRGIEKLWRIYFGGKGGIEKSWRKFKFTKHEVYISLPQFSPKYILAIFLYLLFPKIYLLFLFKKLLWPFRQIFLSLRCAETHTSSHYQVALRRDHSDGTHTLYTWIFYQYTYYKTVLKEPENNNISISRSRTVQYKYKITRTEWSVDRLHLRQKTKKNRRYKSRKSKSATLCKNNLLCSPTRERKVTYS